MKFLKETKGFTLIEVLISMLIAGAIMTVSVTLFQTGIDLRDRIEDRRELQGNMRVAMDYLRTDIQQAGAYLGDYGFFNWYSGSATPNRKFSVDFDNQNWADINDLREAWQTRLNGWMLEDSTEDMVEIWFADSDIFSRIRTAQVSTLIDFDIADNPITRGFGTGDYVLFYDSTKDAVVGNDFVRGTTSITNWVTVLPAVVEYTGEETIGMLMFSPSLPFTDPYITPLSYNICQGLPGKDQFISPDRVHKVHRIVYGVMKKYITGPDGTREVKMLIRDAFNDPARATRYNPLVIATNVDEFKLSTIFKIPEDDVPNFPENWFNSVRLNYHFNTGAIGKMYGADLVQQLGTDYDNEDLTDHDPRDLRRIVVEISGISSKKYMKYAAQSSGATANLFIKPAMGVVNYSGGLGSSIRNPAGTGADWYKHSKISSEIALRALRLSDFAVSPE